MKNLDKNADSIIKSRTLLHEHQIIMSDGKLTKTIYS